MRDYPNQKKILIMLSTTYVILWQNLKSDMCKNEALWAINYERFALLAIRSDTVFFSDNLSLYLTDYYDFIIIMI